MEISQIIGLIVVLILTVLGVFFVLRKSKKYTLVKLLGIMMILVIALTWIFPSGYFNGTEFYDYGWKKQGFTDLTNIVYYAIQMYEDKILFLLSLGAFYAVLTKCNGYKKLVKKLADVFKGIEIIFVLVSSILMTLMASLFTQTFIALVFVPFVISVIHEMKLDKITAFCATFGSILVGVLGATYGTEGLIWFNQYVGTNSSAVPITTAILYRVIVLVVACILFNFFTVLHVKNVKSKKNVEEEIDTPFLVEDVKEGKKTGHVWPFITLFAILLVVSILGFVDWDTNFNITIFNTFHDFLMGIKIGEYSIVSDILGALALNSEDAAFGNWSLFHITVLLGFLSVVFAFIGRVKLDDFIESLGEGMKKMFVPLLLYSASYFVMNTINMSPFVPTITNLVFGKMKTFNPYFVSINAIFCNFFHLDFAFTGFISASYFTTLFDKYMEVIHTIFTTLYGWSNFFVPTSGILILGLSYLRLEYKTWIKYIWMFIVAILVILLVLFTIMTYI